MACALSVLLLLAASSLPAVDDPVGDAAITTEESPFASQGFARLEAGQPDEALIAFDKALKNNAKNLSALLGKAMVFAKQERHTDAFSAYDTVVDYYPGHAFAWNGRGLAAFNLEDFDEALNSFKQATADRPINGFFYESLAWTQMCRGEFASAAASAKTATLMYQKKGEAAVYPLLIAYFSYLEADDTENASRTLAYLRENRPVNRWPGPVVDYIDEAITAPEMISFVTDTAEETEAHTYIGLVLRERGLDDEAHKHLDWVSRHGDSRVFEYTLARSFNLQHRVAVR